MSETENTEESGGVCCCLGLSPTARKCCYYITSLFGGLVFIFGLVRLFLLEPYAIIIGSALIIFAPLWIHNFSSCCKELKNPARLTSTILFLLFFGATITFAWIVKKETLCVVCGFLLAVSGIWYFLSFFENGQKACVECMKACCCSSEKK